MPKAEGVDLPVGKPLLHPAPLATSSNQTSADADLTARSSPSTFVHIRTEVLSGLGSQEAKAPDAISTAAPPSPTSPPSPHETPNDQNCPSVAIFARRYRPQPTKPSRDCPKLPPLNRRSPAKHWRSCKISARKKFSRPAPPGETHLPRSPEIIAARTRTESNKPEPNKTDRGRSVPIANQQPRSPGAVSPRIAILQVRPPLDTQLHARPGPDTTAQHRTPPNMTEHCRTRPTGVGHPIRPPPRALSTSAAQTDAERRSSRRPCRRTGYPAGPQPHHHHLRSTARLARSPASPAR